MTLPRVTSSLILEGLYSDGLMKESELVGLLGESRHGITVPALEAALLRSGALSDDDIGRVKSATSGYELYRGDPEALVDGLSAIVSKRAGALYLGFDGEMHSVAFVEDLPENVSVVAGHIGVNPEALRITVSTSATFAKAYKAVYRGERPASRPAAVDIYQIFDEAVRRHASDVHLAVGRPPVLRVDGILHTAPFQATDAVWMQRELTRIASEGVMERVNELQAVDFALQYGTSRFRCSVGSDRRGLTLAARALPWKIPTPKELQLPPALLQFAELDRGLVLVTGPTGSGKSTTLASLLNLIATTQARHVVTLEDPIEFVLPDDRKATVHQRELGASFATFADGLRQTLRQDPDVILVGELRDLETTRTAVQAAETGHLVFATMHTYDAASTVARIVNAFPTDEQEQIRAQLAYILRGIVAQTLLRHGSGQGRVAAYEVMVSNAAIANNLRKPDGHFQIRQTIEMSAKDGMQTLDMALAGLVRAGHVKEVDAAAKARDLDDFRRRLDQGE